MIGHDAIYEGRWNAWLGLCEGTLEPLPTQVLFLPGEHIYPAL